MFGPTLKLLQGYKGPLPLLTSLQNPKVTLGFNRTDFVRSGYVDPPVTAGTFRYAGQWGYDWSSRGSSTRFDGVATPSAYYLRFSATGVSPSDGPGNRYAGFSLRCLSTVLDM